MNMDHLLHHSTLTEPKAYGIPLRANEVQLHLVSFFNETRIPQLSYKLFLAYESDASEFSATLRFSRSLCVTAIHTSLRKHNPDFMKNSSTIAPPTYPLTPHTARQITRQNS